MKNTIRLHFIGIDDWNRAVFKSDLGYYYGSTDKLFEYDADEKTVLSQLIVDDICYFGTEFNCEPNGGVPKLPIEFITGGNNK